MITPEESSMAMMVQRSLNLLVYQMSKNHRLIDIKRGKCNKNYSVTFFSYCWNVHSRKSKDVY